METETKELTMEVIKQALAKYVTLTYVDYRDTLDDQLEGIQELMRKGYSDILQENIDEWVGDSQYESINFLVDEMTTNLIEDGYDEDDITAFIDANRESINEIIYERDSSHPLKELLRNTTGKACFYDSGLETLCGGYDKESIKSDLKEIKKFLKIKLSDVQFDGKISTMLSQANSTRFVIYFFEEDFASYMNKDESVNTITFKDPFIACINNWDGSGDHVQLKGLTVELSYNADNLFICKNTRYSYTHDVCGMYDSWCSDSIVNFTNKKTRSKKQVSKSSLNAKAEYDKECDDVFKKGGCTAGDMNMGRHRNTVYGNDFPCGWKCPKCGTFWID